MKYAANTKRCAGCGAAIELSSALNHCVACMSISPKAGPERGVKHDTGKPRPTLVLHTMAKAIDAVVAVGEHGARKYAPDNWLHVERAQQRYTDAMYRHLLNEAQGNTVDKDSGLLEAAHVAWNALARLELMLRDAEKAPHFNYTTNTWGGRVEPVDVIVWGSAGLYRSTISTDFKSR